MKLVNIGLKVDKRTMDPSDVRTIKRDLKIKKNVVKGYGPPAKPFGVYRETENYVFLPKFYEHKHPVEDCRIDGQKTNLLFNGQLRPQQAEVKKLVFEEFRKNQRTIMCAPTGMGKCHGIDTPIIMYDGSIKKVQDVIVGDLLMGEDSQPRKVLSLGRGRDIMYKIIPTKGDPFIVNSEHILSLKISGNKIKKLIKKTKTVYDVRYFNIYSNSSTSKRFDTLEEAEIFLQSVATTIDIPLNKYLEFNNSAKHILKLYRVGVDFPERKIKFDPYIIGLWLGDGCSRGSMISNQDAVILRYLTKKLDEYCMYLQYSGAKYDYRLVSFKHRFYGQPFLAELKRCNLINNKHIPDDYKFNTREVRLQVLAGLIDSDGYHHKNMFSIAQKSEKMTDDIVFLARSLGFAAYKSVKKTSWTYKGIKKYGTAFRVNISGDLSIVPTKVKIKQANSREQIKRTLVTGFKVEKLEEDDYYGFTIDGNHRYLLGDFTVTHNTAMGLNFAATLGTKTLIVVHTRYLMNQWEERIKQFLPQARIGFYHGPVCDIEDKDIIIGMLQSLSMKDYNTKIFGDVGFTIFDEVHKVGAEQFSKALLRVSSKYMLGLSATPYRGDGLTKILYLHFGTILNPFKGQKIDQRVHVEMVPYIPPNFRETRIRFGGYNFANMTNQLCDDSQRNEMIIEKLVSLVEEGRQVLVLSARVEHVKFLAGKLGFLGIPAGVFIGGKKMADLDKATENQVIVATYNMFREGVDVPKLNTLLFGTPVVKVTQAIGRVLRKKHEDYYPLIVDIWDTVSQYEKWGLKRMKIYKTKGFVCNMSEEDYNTREELENQQVSLDDVLSE